MVQFVFAGEFMNRRLLLLLVVLVFFISVTSFAQEASSTSAQRVGVDATKRVSLTLRDAILMALENNRDIEIERTNVQMNEYDLRASKGVFDPVLNISLASDRRTTPVASLLAGGDGGRLLTTGLTGSANMSQRLQKNGSSWQALFDNNRSTTQNLFNDLNPQYQSTLSLTFTQPLLRNRTIDAARRQIKIASRRLDISDSQFRQRAIDIIAQVQRAYWDLIFARRDFDIKRESLNIGQQQLARNERLVEAGTLAPSDVISTKVDIERRKDEMEAVMESVQRAENSLKNLMLQPSSTEMWNSVLEPVEEPQVSQGEAIPLTDAIRLAHENRPEIRQLNLRREVNDTDVEFFTNQTKPQVDLFATYATIGLAGNPRTTINPIFASNTLLRDRIDQLSRLAGLPPLPVTSAGGIPEAFVGGYWQSFGNVLKNNFRVYRFGVNLNLPLWNRTAQAQLGRALVEGRQIDVQKQRVLQQVEVEVRNALQSVETAKRRVEAAKNSRANAELQLQSEERKFEAGQSTNFLILDRQNALIAARGREVRALVDYNKAVAELQRVMSTTLTSNNVEVNPVSAPAAPRKQVNP
jgi:HAE1 family hydrophobic/amphiphilic exporter-1